ncbi:MAG: 23S rRNA (guanosine(2251)-2'-O)-methyltransferase RlmB [Pseudomonadota bacterium]
MSTEHEQLQWVYGFHAVEALLSRHPRRVKQLYIQSNRQDQRVSSLQETARQAGIETLAVSKAALQALVDGNHQGVAAHCSPAPVRNENELEDYLSALSGNALVLVLDGVTDPHNLGACIRSAEAAGADAIIIPKDKSAGMTAIVRKVACGAAELLPVFRVTNLARSLRQFKRMGLWVSGLAGEAENTLYDLDLTVPTVLVLGAEGKGLRQLSRKECDHLAKIPMPGHVESLNVSVTAGVALFEAGRQRASQHQ